jgi:predicted RNA binding protein YcfA (HicA-like mRNA interferase family)
MKLPALTGKQVRQKGSHVFLRHPDGRRTVMPVHTGESYRLMKGES